MIFSTSRLSLSFPSGLLALLLLPADGAPSGNPAPEQFSCQFSCDDQNACTIDSCDTSRGICRHDALGCDDGNPCTSDLCYGSPTGSPCGQAGCCHLPLSDIACDDGNSCTGGDHCLSGTCVATKLAPGTACDDRNPCTGPDTCNASAQCLGEVLFGSECDDRNVCTMDFCDETGSCIGLPFDPGGPCDDGNACTVGDICVQDEAGVTAVCQGTEVSCSDPNPCTEDRCDTATGQCSNPPVNCDDGDPCTSEQWVCIHGVICEITPNFFSPCSVGPCQNGFCNDSGTGTLVCVLTEAPCDDQNLCTEDACDVYTGACSHNPTNDPCDDGNDCTFSDNCSTGSCTGTFDPQAGCDDFNSCTFNDNCSTGSCRGTFDAQAGTPTVSIHSVVPQVLAPANHKLVEVNVSVSAQASCGGGLAPILTSITSNQPDDAPGPGDGHTVGDIQGAEFGTADTSFLLRAEFDRNVGTRIYTVTYTATASDGSTTSASSNVTVPTPRSASQPQPTVVPPWHEQK